jgi:hypothetical protein
MAKALFAMLIIVTHIVYLSLIPQHYYKIFFLST